MEPRDDTAQIVAAGLLSGTAFLVEHWVDQMLWPDGYSDMKLLGLAVTRQRPHYLAVGVPWHLLNSIAFAWAYARWAGPRLPGPGWLRGLLLAVIENNVLWFTLIPVANRLHPAIQDGTMPPIRRGGIDWVVGNLRHIALGLVLGGCCPLAPRR
ncbi:MAG TPA: hypothetical protein VKY74_19600 [Chloroflexia bacterium]|nr:hypothetical protein [Chloroflexia bacterium]